MKNFRKLFALILVCTMVVTLFTGCGEKDGDSGSGNEHAVAMITDSGDITDQSFNQTTYEACKEYCTNNNIKFNYYKPAGDSNTDRVASAEKAIAEGFDTIVVPGYQFGELIVSISDKYKDINFIGLDIGESDLIETAVNNKGEKYDPAKKYNLSDYVYMDNVYCVTYDEEISGYMAGYAAVKMGFKKLGFLGGMAVPSVKRYGYGFVQGADAAAKELSLSDIEVKYGYGNQFYGDADITSVMDTWYGGGTEVVFACGGGIYTSVAEAAVKKNGKVIGVDTDQKELIDSKYGSGLTVTSAMKGLGESAKEALQAIIKDNKWKSDFAGKLVNKGVISEKPEENFVQLAPSTVYNDTFKKTDYETLVKKFLKNEVQIIDDVSKQATDFATTAKVLDQGSLK